MSVHPFTLDETRAWWRRTVNDETQLKRWLQKLYRTELEGYTDHLGFLATEGAIEERTAKILLNVALDELKHSHLLADILADRGYNLGAPPASLYWEEMNSHVVCLEDYCAVNHYGEALAAFRFEVIHEMPETPSDLRRALEIILPDEQFHRVTLEKLAGDKALARMAEVHEKASKKLKGL